MEGKSDGENILDKSPDKCTSEASDSISQTSSGECWPSSSLYTLTRPKPGKTFTTTSSGDLGESHSGYGVGLSSSSSSCSTYEWQKSLLETEKNITFKFVDDGIKDYFPRNEAIHAMVKANPNSRMKELTDSNVKADIFEIHDAKFPYFDEKLIDVYQTKYRSIFSLQNVIPTAHFLKMMDMGEAEEKKRDEEKQKLKLHEHMIDTCIQGKNIEKKTVFENKMKKEPISQNEANIWNKCLGILHPRYATEVFYSQGVNLVCVTSLKSIYEIESVPSKYFKEYENVILSDLQNDLIAFLKEMCVDENKDHKHFLSTLCSKIYNIKDDAFTTFWKEMVSKYLKKEDFSGLVSHMIIHLGRIAEERSHDSFNEKDLQNFLLLLLNEYSSITTSNPKYKGSYAADVFSIEIKQLRQAKSGSEIQSQKTIPDVQYWEQDLYHFMMETPVRIQILICQLMAPSESTAANWKPQMETEMFEGCLLSTKIKCTLLWQIYEAIFGTMMKAKHDEKMLDKDHVVFQGGMLVCNDRVRSVVLAVNAETYKDIRQNKCARETFSWIAANPMWGRLYIEAHDHHILDALSRITFTYNNFCKCVSLCTLSIK